jgi:hypothetical protein
MRTSIATESAKPDRPNEDFAATTDELAIVLDGATTPGILDTGCTHGTRWFSRNLGAEIIYQLTIEPTMTLADGLASAIKGLAERHAATCDIGHPGHPSATVAMLRETAYSIEYLVLSDATAAINTARGVEVITDPRLDQVANDFNQALRDAPQGTQRHDEAFADLTTALRTHRNRPGGFWVAAVDPQAAYEARTGAIARADVLSATVMSDGASILADRFNVMQWTDMLSLLADDGPHALLREVRRVEDSDAQGTRWPRGKVHDDATVIFCQPDGPRARSHDGVSCCKA